MSGVQKGTRTAYEFFDLSDETHYWRFGPEPTQKEMDFNTVWECQVVETDFAWAVKSADNQRHLFSEHLYELIHEQFCMRGDALFSFSQGEDAWMPEISDEAAQELAKIISAWVRRHVGRIYKITQADSLTDLGLKRRGIPTSGKVSP